MLGVRDPKGVAMNRQFSGSRLRALRMRAGKPLEQVALDIGRSAYSVQEYERGRVVPPSKVLLAISDSLGCTIDNLFDTPGIAA